MCCLVFLFCLDGFGTSPQLGEIVVWYVCLNCFSVLQVISDCFAPRQKSVRLSSMQMDATTVQFPWLRPLPDRSSGQFLHPRLVAPPRIRAMHPASSWLSQPESLPTFGYQHQQHLFNPPHHSGQYLRTPRYQVNTQRMKFACGSPAFAPRPQEVPGRPVDGVHTICPTAAPTRRDGYPGFAPPLAYAQSLNTSQVQAMDGIPSRSLQWQRVPAPHPANSVMVKPAWDVPTNSQIPSRLHSSTSMASQTEGHNNLTLIQLLGYRAQSPIDEHTNSTSSPSSVTNAFSPPMCTSSPKQGNAPPPNALQQISVLSPISPYDGQAAKSAPPQSPAVSPVSASTITASNPSPESLPMPAPPPSLGESRRLSHMPQPVPSAPSSSTPVLPETSQSVELSMPLPKTTDRNIPLFLRRRKAGFLPPILVPATSVPAVTHSLEKKLPDAPSCVSTGADTATKTQLKKETESVDLDLEILLFQEPWLLDFPPSRTPIVKMTKSELAARVEAEMLQTGKGRMAVVC